MPLPALIWSDVTECKCDKCVWQSASVINQIPLLTTRLWPSSRRQL